MERIIEIIKYESENSRIDFKRDQYHLGDHPKKNDLIKDICAFANQPSDEDKYIVIGIKDIDGVEKQILGIENPVDEAKYQQIILENIEPRVNFEYKVIKYQDKKIAYFRIFNNFDRPYLFKKDLIAIKREDIKNKFTEYKYGDGYVRIGTTCKKIGRKELDDLYSLKLKKADRRGDILIHPKVGMPDDHVLSNYNVAYLDIDLENTSNKSICLEIEIRILKNVSFIVSSEYELRKEISEMNRKRNKDPFSNSFAVDPTIPYNLHLSFNEDEKELTVTRNGFRKDTAITLPQNFIEENVFSKSIILCKSNPGQISGKVCIRSDDFVDGMLVKDVVFKIENRV